LDGIHVDEVINIRKEHNAIDEQGEDGFKGIDIGSFSKIGGFLVKEIEG